MTCEPNLTDRGARHSSQGNPDDAAPPEFPLNVFASVTAKSPKKSGSATAAQIAGSLRAAKQVPRKDLAPLVTMVKYRDGATTRSIADIETVHAVYGDIDHGFDADAFEAGLARLERMGAQVVAYQTFNHRPEAPRWRVIVLLNEPLTPEDYREAWDGLNVVFAGMLDAGAKDCARLNYWCSCPAGEMREVRTLNIAAVQ